MHKILTTNTLYCIYHKTNAPCVDNPNFVWITLKVNYYA